MAFPGERIQVDIKYVPSECIVDNGKFYQYTTIDEFSRFRYIQIYNENNVLVKEKFFYDDQDLP